MANGSLTDNTITRIRGIHQDVREGRRSKDISALYDLVELQSGLLIQVQLMGCAVGCGQRKFGWPAAATTIAIVVSTAGIILRIL